MPDDELLLRLCESVPIREDDSVSTLCTDAFEDEAASFSALDDRERLFETTTELPACLFLASLAAAAAAAASSSFVNVCSEPSPEWSEFESFISFGD